MKTFAFILIGALALAVIPASGSVIYIDLQNDNGETRVSMSGSSDLTGTGINATFSGWIGIGGMFPGSMTGLGGTSNYVSGVGSFVGYVEPLSGFGTFEDVTTGGTATMNTLLAIPDFLGGGSVVNIRFANELTNSIGDLIRYIPATDSETVNIPFSSFNPGTYNVTPQQFPINFVLTVEPIPEPSPVLIAALGWLGLVCFRRRRALPN